VRYLNFGSPVADRNYPPADLAIINPYGFARLYIVEDFRERDAYARRLRELSLLVIDG
jgi:hypothetical protein